MKVYEGLNEKTKDIIVDVLEKYCVPKRVEIIKKETFFGDYKTYNIHLDLKEEPLKFIKEKIQERLNLEKSFNLKAVNPDTLKDIPQNYTESKIVEEEGESIIKKGFFEKVLDKIFNNEDPIDEIKQEVENHKVDSLLGALLMPLMDSGEEIKFEDLEEEEKEILLKRCSLKDLKSKNCRIIKTKYGLSVEIKKKL
jgi:hypothetical protein